jgi:hypothetical protein
MAALVEPLTADKSASSDENLTGDEVSEGVSEERSYAQQQALLEQQQQQLLQLQELRNAQLAELSRLRALMTEGGPLSESEGEQVARATEGLNDSQNADDAPDTSQKNSLEADTQTILDSYDMGDTYNDLDDEAQALVRRYLAGILSGEISLDDDSEQADIVNALSTELMNPALANSGSDDHVDDKEDEEALNQLRALQAHQEAQLAELRVKQQAQEDLQKEQLQRLNEMRAHKAYLEEQLRSKLAESGFDEEMINALGAFGGDGDSDMFEDEGDEGEEDQFPMETLAELEARKQRLTEELLHQQQLQKLAELRQQRDSALAYQKQLQDQLVEQKQRFLDAVENDPDKEVANNGYGTDDGSDYVTVNPDVDADSNDFVDINAVQD